MRVLKKWQGKLPIKILQPVAADCWEAMWVQMAAGPAPKVERPCLFESRTNFFSFLILCDAITICVLNLLVGCATISLVSWKLELEKMHCWLAFSMASLPMHLCQFEFVLPPSLEPTKNGLIVCKIGLFKHFLFGILRWHILHKKYA